MTGRRLNFYGSVMAEFALTIPVFLLIIFSFMELGRALYVQNTLAIAAQKAAALIAINAKRTSTYTVSGFSAYASQIRFPGAVVSNDQFSFDVTDALGNSTVLNGEANGGTSTKVVVMVTFPPPSNPSLRIPIVDPGNLIGMPVFGQNGLTLSTSATCFLERSRRPSLN
jgi:Flp pilus assembly protein TadG